MIMPLLALLALFPVPATSVQTPPASGSAVQVSQGSLALDGRWDGAMSVPGGVTIPFQLEIAGAGGTFAAPDMDVSGVPITVTREAGRVLVRLPQAGAAFDAELADDGARLVGLWSQGGRSFPATFTRGGETLAERPQTPRAPFPYSARDMTLPGGAPDLQLAGTLVLPEGAGSAPAVLLLGGNGPQTRDGTHSQGHRPMAVIADRLARTGVGSLRLDKRGVGGSGGSYNRATGEDFAADAGAALAWLRARPEVDAARTCVLGWSEGALIALMISEAPSPACVILLSPPGLSGPALVAEQVRLQGLAAGADPGSAEEAAKLSFDLVSARAGGADEAGLVQMALARGRSEAEARGLARDAASPELGVFLDMDPTVPASRVSAPVLIVAGSRDRQTPAAVNLPPLVRTLAPRGGLEVAEFPDLNHALQPAMTGEPAEYDSIAVTIDEAALDAITDFVSRTLGTATTP